jgi:hypothetical protein
MSPGRHKSRARRLKKAVERAEQFYGALEDRQVEVLRAFIARSAFDPQRSYAERQRRQQDLLQTLRAVAASGGSAQDWAPARQAVHGFILRALHSPDPAYASYLEREIQDNCKAFAELHNSTSPEQRARAAKRLRAYERDARELAARP